MPARITFYRECTPNDEDPNKPITRAERKELVLDELAEILLAELAADAEDMNAETDKLRAEAPEDKKDLFEAVTAGSLLENYDDTGDGDPIGLWEDLKNRMWSKLDQEGGDVPA